MGKNKPVTIKQAIIGFIVAITAVIGGGAAVDNFGGINYTESKTLLNAISASTTSAAIDIDGAKRMTLFFTVSGLGGSGIATSTFTFQGSIDGTNYVTLNKFVDNLTNTNVQGLTRVANMVIDSNTTDYLSLDLEHDIFKYFKVTDTMTGATTSSVTVKALLDY